MIYSINLSEKPLKNLRAIASYAINEKRSRINLEIQVNDKYDDLSYQNLLLAGKCKVSLLSKAGIDYELRVRPITGRACLSLRNPHQVIEKIDYFLEQSINQQI